MKKLIFLFFVFISFNSYSQDIKKMSVNLYPNPATDYITVKFENNINVDDFDFKTYFFTRLSQNCTSFEGKGFWRPFHS